MHVARSRSTLPRSYPLNKVTARKPERSLRHRAMANDWIVAGGDGAQHPCAAPVNDQEGGHAPPAGRVNDPLVLVCVAMARMGRLYFLKSMTHLFASLRGL